MITRALLTVILLGAAWAAQAPGTLKGRIVLDATGDPLHHATVLVVQLGKRVETNDSGEYEFRGIPPGKYNIVAHMHSLTDERKTVEISSGATVTADFRLKIETVRQEITVTASGKEETTLEAFNAVSSMESLELAARQGTSLGDVLEDQTGVARRSYGPGTTRPVVRGFDGDRVLIMQDGMRTGTLGSQSGDHGEPVNAQSLERVEVVRGPATLLYGSNALGGVVNMITGHHQMHEHPHEGWRGYITGQGGTNNNMGSGSGGVEYGVKHWLFTADSGVHTASDYGSPLGPVVNSGSKLRNGMLGGGHFGERHYTRGSYNITDGDYRIPSDGRSPERVRLDYRLQNARFGSGIKNLGQGLEFLHLSLNYSDWNHRELAAGDVENEFFNKQFVYRAVADQKKRGRWSGSFGAWGMLRDYKAAGEEAITPPVVQNAIAGFGVEQLEFGRYRVQFGARLENNRYSPERGFRSRSFTGVSGSIGLSAPVWNGGVLLASYTHSYRAPALEELYAHGPHAGNLTYEIGDSNLRREVGDGADFSLRHQSRRVRTELNYFLYHMHDFVYLAPTGEINSGLVEAVYAQRDARYQGVEGRLNFELRPEFWLNLGFDAVDAELTSDNTPLPRIPPFRCRLGADYRYKGIALMPELVLASRQDRIFSTETPTAGYGVLNLRASYTVTRQHSIHMFGVNFYNAGNNLYRNHLSFIKAFAPEMGRGVQFTYTIRFF